jgi:hypothetical protein
VRAAIPAGTTVSFLGMGPSLFYLFLWPVILPLLLYGCETWSLTLRVFENRVLRRIFRPKREEVTGGWRKLHNEELRDLFSSSSIIRMIK